MTVRMVAPEHDMISGVIEGIEYKFQKDDKWGCVVDAHEAHINTFRALGFTPASEMPVSAPIELSSEEAPAPAPTDEEIKAAEALAAQQAEAEAAAVKEAEEKAAAEAKAAEEAAGASADTSADAPAKKGKGK